MKYKLINSVTKIETLCDKVTIDGYDYYVSDGDRVVGDYYIGKGFNGNNIFEWTSSQETQYPNQKGNIIATTNPNIDVPKVVDEVWKIAKDYVKTLGILGSDLDNITSENLVVWGYKKSQETHPYSEEDMIELIRFITHEFNVDSFQNRRYRDSKHYATKELLQIWKEQKPKIVYYG